MDRNIDIVERNELIRIYLDKGFSVIPIKNDKRPYIPWKEFQNKHTTMDLVEEWSEKFPDFNTGIVTGSVSHFYVLDFDTDESFKAFPDDLKDTMTTKTQRGMHLCYYSEESYRSKVFDINGHKVEFRGEHEYTIEPYSIINGFEYQIIRSVHEIKKLPLYIESLCAGTTKDNKIQRNTVREEPSDNVPHKSKPNIYIRTSRLCIYQILNKDLVIGERELSFFILKNILLKDHHDPRFIEYIITSKNNSLPSPLEPKLVESILSSKLYPVTCKYVRDKLPYVTCIRCPYNRKAEGIDFPAIIRNDQRKYSKADVQVAFSVLYGYKTVKQIINATGLSERQVYKSLKKIRGGYK